MKKSNNKGFSLVELIVVVLIMAIIAVALSPQVMKWVNRSRIATDATNYDTLVNEIKVALVNPSAYAEVTGKGTGVTITVTTGSTGTTMAASDSSTVADLTAALDAIDPTWSSLKAKASSASYVITIKNDGSIVNTTAPDSSTVEAD